MLYQQNRLYLSMKAARNNTNSIFYRDDQQINIHDKT